MGRVGLSHMNKDGSFTGMERKTSRSAVVKYGLFLLKAAVSVALIWFLMQEIDFDEMRARVLAASPALLALSAFFYLVQVGWATGRWEAVLNALEAPLGWMRVFRFTFIGAFFNQTLPTSVGGDAVKMILANREGVRLTTSLNSVLLERVVTAVTLVPVVLVTLPFLLPRVDYDTGLWIIGGLALMTAGAFVGLTVLMLLDRLPINFGRWRVLQAMSILSRDTRTLFLVPANLWRVFIWGVICHINLTIVAYVIALALKAEVSFVDSLALVPPVLMVTILPISIAGWGVREGAMVAAFAMIGVPAETSLTLSILFGLVGIVTALPGGGIWIFHSGSIRGNLKKADTLSR